MWVEKEGMPSSDDGVEWQSLPASLFDDAPLVPVACTKYTLLTDGCGGSVTVQPQRQMFERADTGFGAAGTGADVARMTGALLWDSALVLASWLVRNRQSAKDVSSAIELGAGLGLAGLAAASALGIDVTLTDRAELLPLLERGIATNGLLSTRAMTLEWGDDDAARKLGTFDLVLASDCIYEESAIPLLVRTLVILLKPSGCVMLCYVRQLISVSWPLRALTLPGERAASLSALLSSVLDTRLRRTRPSAGRMHWRLSKRKPAAPPWYGKISTPRVRIPTSLQRSRPILRVASG